MLNWPHVHLMINHFPVVGIMGVILLLAYSLIRKSEEVKMVTLGRIVLLSLMTIAVYLTGQGAADMVKKLPGVTEASIGRHEEVADLSLILMEASGIVAVAGLLLMRRKGVVPKWLVYLVLILSLVTAVVVGYTANLGGEIRHSEIREPGAWSPSH